MASDRDLTATYVILAKAFLGIDSYDAWGAFVLLQSIAEGLRDRAPTMVHVASHLHVVAALGGVEAAKRDARRSLVRLAAILEDRLATDAAA